MVGRLRYMESYHLAQRTEGGIVTRRGKVLVTCYRHRNCKFFLGRGRDPGNYELKRWLWEVPPTPDGAGSAQNKELAEQHKAIARRRWGAK